MIKELVHDEAILSAPCEVATAADADVAQDLVETLLSIEDAACLAANQIGVAKAIVALADDEGNAHVMFNPKVLFWHGRVQGRGELPDSRGLCQGDALRKDQGFLR